MSRPLLAFNVLIGLLGGLFAAGLVHEWLTPLEVPPPAAVAPKPAVGPAPAPKPAVAPAGYGVVATRNLFNPDRAEVTVAAPAVATGPKPLLHGVVVDGQKRRAYLEDPALKGTFGYEVGDTVAGGRVQAIRADRVVIARNGGVLEILLQDPAKPKAVAAVAPGAPGATPTAAAPAGPPARPLPPNVLRGRR